MSCVAAGRRSAARFYELTAHTGIPKDPGMRFFVLALIALLGLSAPAALAQGARRSEDAPSQTRKPPSRSPSRAVTLDTLFERLAKAETEIEAQGIAGLIERRWSRSGSDTADLLLIGLRRPSRRRSSISRSSFSTGW